MCIPLCALPCVRSQGCAAGRGSTQAAAESPGAQPKFRAENHPRPWGLLTELATTLLTPVSVLRPVEGPVRVGRTTRRMVGATGRRRPGHNGRSTGSCLVHPGLDEPGGFQVALPCLLVWGGICGSLHG